MSVDFELNLAGLNDLMKSAEMQQILGAACSEVAANAGKPVTIEFRMRDADIYAMQFRHAQ